MGASVAGEALVGKLKYNNNSWVTANYSITQVMMVGSML